MTAFDYAVLAVMGFSALMAVVRGFVREVLSLASWAVAITAGWWLSGRVAAMLPLSIPGESLRLLAAFVLVAGLALLGMVLLSLALVELVRAVGLGFADRVLGLAFGLARGVLVVVTLVLLAGLTRLPEHPAWRDAMLSPPLEVLAIAVKPWLPTEIARRIRYDATRQVVYTPPARP
jgi:membrane protein required for colicin V production